MLEKMKSDETRHVSKLNPLWTHLHLSEESLDWVPGFYFVKSSILYVNESDECANFSLSIRIWKPKINWNFLNLVPIVSCGQCPICKTYVPIPLDLLASLTAASAAKLGSTVKPVPTDNPAIIAPANAPMNQSIPLFSVDPLVSRINLNIVQQYLIR